MVEPVAVTLNDWLSPVHPLTFSGWALISTGEFTASVATSDVRLEVQVPDNYTRYFLPLSAAVNPVRLSVDKVAPEILLQVVPPSLLTCHW